MMETEWFRVMWLWTSLDSRAQVYTGFLSFELMFKKKKFNYIALYSESVDNIPRQRVSLIIQVISHPNLLGGG